LIIIPVTSVLMRQNAVQWLLQFILIRKHVYMIGYWLLLLSLMALILYGSEVESSDRWVIVFKCLSIPNIIYRKLFHIIAFGLFVPGTLMTPELMCVAYVAALVLFILVECTRFFLIYSNPKAVLSIYIDTMIRRFTDERDSGLLVLTHIYLLVGCMTPLLLHIFANRSLSNCFHETLAPLTGVLILGIGDTMASLVGIYFGRNRWSNRSKKTIEGTLGAIAGVLMTGYILGVWNCGHYCQQDKEVQDYERMMCNKMTTGITTSVVRTTTAAWTISTVLTCLLEATTNQIDNLVLPIFQYAIMKMWWS